MMDSGADELSWHEKLAALARVMRYRPRFTAGLVVLGGLAAFFEGIGLSFVYPILQVA